MTGHPNPGVLLILDGWGHGPPGPANAVTAARTPALDRLVATCPAGLAEASGEAVGLPSGTVGNSEIGHLVIGAGRPIPYDSLLVARQAESGQLRSSAILTDLCVRLRDRDRALHLIGLCSDGKIHADIAHLPELLTAATAHGVPRVWIHAITDGRDVSDGTAARYLEQVAAIAVSAGAGQIATVTGRGYALDKAGNLALTQRAGLAVADASGTAVATFSQAIAASERGDEWVAPSVIVGTDGNPLAPVRDGDGIVFFNFRSDRIRQLADFLVEHLAATGRPVTAVSLTQYDTQAPLPALVPRTSAGKGLAGELARHGMSSLHVAETEKFEHVTFYLNGRDASPRPLQKHEQVTGAAGTRDYRACPQMHISQVAHAVATACSQDDISLIVANFANMDVVGHTGDLAATVQAVEHTDTAVATVVRAAAGAGRWALLVGDHGNAEMMARPGPSGEQLPYGGHTTNPVPVIVVPARGQPIQPLAGGSATLADIAPTVLSLLGCPASAAMTGTPLL